MENLGALFDLFLPRDFNSGQNYCFLENCLFKRFKTHPNHEPPPLPSHQLLVASKLRQPLLEVLGTANPEDFPARCGGQVLLQHARPLRDRRQGGLERVQSSSRYAAPVRKLS